MEKNKRENKSNVLYFLGRILTNKVVIALIVIAAIGGISFGVKEVAFTDSKTTKLGFEDIGELATQEAHCTEVNVTDRANGLLSNAEKNAKTIISSFFWKEYNKDEYKIKYIG